MPKLPEQTLTPRARVLELLKKERPVCVSILMPTHRAGAETRQDPIRFKNLLRQAQEKLTSAGLDKRAIQELLAPLEERIGDSTFWQHQSDGLAVFRTSDSTDWIQTLWTLPELCVVGEQFAFLL
jgi:hypothetical protein